MPRALLVVKALDVDAILIQFRCRRFDHQAAVPGVSPVFMHQGGWAYCLAGQSGREHDFVTTGGRTRKWVEGSQPEGASPVVDPETEVAGRKLSRRRPSR